MIGGRKIINYINNNSYNKNLYEKKYIKPDVKIKTIQNKVEDNKKFEELTKLDKIQVEVVENFIKKIQQENQKVQLIAIKMIKGSNITKYELEFISKKYPDIKEIVESLTKEYNYIREELKNCKTESQKQMLINFEKNNLERIIKEDVMYGNYVRLKSAVLEEVRKDYEKEYSNKNEVKFNINPCIYLNSNLLLNKEIAVIIIIVLIVTIYLFAKIIS